MKRNDVTPWRVLKFGGTSVATADRWANIERILRRTREEGFTPFLVCSATAGTTDDLEAMIDLPPALRRTRLGRIRERHISLARDMELWTCPDLEDELDSLERFLETGRDGIGCDPRAQAELLAYGERLSTRLGAAWMRERGTDLHWLDARDALSTTHASDALDEVLTAECNYAPDADLQKSLAGREAVITQGFVARNAGGETVVLGRGGSDTAASYFATKLEARRVEIWTDVPGLFTANPRVVPDARLIRRVDYREAECLATMGATALHPRSLRPVREHDVAMWIRWTDNPDRGGTRIGSGENEPGVKAILSRDGLCLVSAEREAEWQPVGFMADVAEKFREHAVSMDLVSSSPSDIRATVSLETHPGVEARLTPLLRDLNTVSRASLRQGMASVSFVGSQIRNAIPVVAESFRHLRGHEIHLLSQSADDYALTYVIDESSAHEIVRDVHAELFRDREPDKSFGNPWSSYTRKEREMANIETVPQPDLNGVAS